MNDMTAQIALVTLKAMQEVLKDARERAALDYAIQSFDVTAGVNRHPYAYITEADIVWVSEQELI